jgi:radical SAM superfamily enzyme YgiQ (UPF0313 family)
MKIILANPLFKNPIDKTLERYYIRSGSRWPHSGIKRKGTLPHYLPFPFSLAYAAGLLRNNGFDVVVIDAIALDIGEDDFVDMLKSERPDLVLFEATTPTIEKDVLLTQKIKQNVKTRVALCGAHATVFSRELLRSCPSIDFILRNEYEYSFLELAEHLRDKKKPHDVKGITYTDNSTVVFNDDAPLIDPLDTLPVPARELFPTNDKPNPAIYWDGFCQYRPAIQMHASRGCPYRCYFCMWNQIMYRCGKYRMFSATRVVDEIEDAMNKYNAREVYFDDDDFTISKQHVKDICSEIKKRELRIKWSCMGDAINLNEDILKTMAGSGCVGLKFGVESGSPRIVHTIGKPVNLARVKDVARLCARYGIKSHATFSIGLLGDDRDSIHETIQYAKELDVDTIQVSICTPYPGTEFFKRARDLNLIRTTDWEKYDGKITEVLEPQHLSWQEIEALKTKFLKEWSFTKITTPAWVMRQIKYLLRWIGGIGFTFFITQLIHVWIDELERKRFE